MSDSLFHISIWSEKSSFVPVWVRETGTCICCSKHLIHLPAPRWLSVSNSCCMKDWNLQRVSLSVVIVQLFGLKRIRSLLLNFSARWQILASLTGVGQAHKTALTHTRTVLVSLSAWKKRINTPSYWHFTSTHTCTHTHTLGISALVFKWASFTFSWNTNDLIHKQHSSLT